MTPEEWRKVKDIFDAAAELAPGLRAAHVAKAANGDIRIANEVQSLLGSLEDAGDFIEAAPRAATTADRNGADTIGSDEFPGRLRTGALLGPIESFS